MRVRGSGSGATCLGRRQRCAPLLRNIPPVAPLGARAMRTQPVPPLAATAAPAARKGRGQGAGAADPLATLSQDDYGASSIQVLEGLEPVRKRPGMYIGGTGSDGLHHLIWEVVDNAVDEVQAGHARRVEVDVDLGTGWVTVTDDGRGIPVDLHPTTGKSALETVLTVLHAGGKFGGDNSGYKVSGGLHGVGISVVNALSSELEVRVWRNGVRYSQRYSRGAAQEELQEEVLQSGSEEAGRDGTQVRFLYDSSIFAKDVSYSADVIATRLHELAFLNSAATIRFRATRRGKAVPGISRYLASRRGGGGGGSGGSLDGSGSDGDGDGGFGEGEEGEYASTSAPVVAAAPVGGKRGGKKKAGAEDAGGNGAAAKPVYGVVRQDGEWQVFQYSGGLREFVGCLQSSYTPLHEAICVSRTDSVSGVVVDVALQWATNSYKEEVRGFANSIHTVDGGTHMDGLRAGLTKAVTQLGRKQKIIKDSDPPLTGDNVREGLGAVVAVKVPDPEFEGQTKTRLGNPEVRKIVETAVHEAVGEWLEAHPVALAALCNKALTSARAAEAARKARELVRRKTSLTRSTLPGKLADCSSENREETEIYIVEGDSAGGSAKQARDRRFQAILPLKGKILNVERLTDATEEMMYKNTEISNLIVALGLGTERSGGAEAAAGEASQTLAGLRYGKIVVLTDADVDGAHIRTLLLTFLFRHRPQLFTAGHVYVAVPPLFKVDKGRSSWWAHSDADLQRLVAEQKLAPGSYSIQRFKGLGEMMPLQLWDTTLNPASRLLRRLTVSDAAAADDMLTRLMGSKVEPRKALIDQFSRRLSLDALDV